MTATALYKHFDADGQLLYVGITNNPKRRLAEHKCRSVWADQIDRVDVKWVRSRAEAEAEERSVILLQRPLFNGGKSGPAAETGDVFRDWLNGSQYTQITLAEEIGTTQANLSKMLSGKTRISLLFAAQIEELSKGDVPMRYWLFGKTAERQAALTTPEGLSMSASFAGEGADG